MEISQYSDLWVYHIIPQCPIEFLYVCKQWREKAFSLLNTDPRMTRKKVNRALKHASQIGHIRLLKIILTNPRIKIQGGGQYALRAAASAGHVEAVKLLLRVPGVDPGSTGYYKLARHPPAWKKTFSGPAIDCAIKEDRLEIVHLMLDAFPAISDQALRRAVELGKEAIVNDLLNSLQKYPINMRTYDYLALSLQYPAIFEALLQIPNIQLGRAFYDCTKQKERIALARRLLDDPRINLLALPPHEQSSVLVNLASNKDVEVVRKVLTLIHPTVRPSDEVINAATSALDYDMTRMLLEVPEFKKVNYWSKRCSNCVDTTDLEVGNKLLELVLKESEVSPGDINTAVETAAKNNNVVALEMLLKHAASTATYHNAVKVALNNKAEKAAIYLLSHSVVDATYDNNYYIRYASEKGLTEVVKVLLQNKAVNPAVAQNSAVRAACLTGNVEVVKVLLADPRVNPADFSNHAIQVAALSGHVEIVKALLADPRVNPSANNNYALKFATQRGHTEIAELLTSHPRFKK